MDNAKEYANKLIEKYITQEIVIIAKCDNSICIPSGCMTYISAISCAIIAVDELINDCEDFEDADKANFWERVKQELIKLKNQ